MERHGRGARRTFLSLPTVCECALGTHDEWWKMNVDMKQLGSIVAVPTGDENIAPTSFGSACTIGLAPGSQRRGRPLEAPPMKS